MSEHHIHIPTPLETDRIYCEVVKKVVDALHAGVRDSYGRIYVLTANIDQPVRDSLMAKLKERGWHVEVNGSYGVLHWHIKPE